VFNNSLIELQRLSDQQKPNQPELVAAITEANSVLAEAQKSKRKSKDLKTQIKQFKAQVELSRTLITEAATPQESVAA
jgi:ABC-type transporter Mla subunit MlaD